MSPPQAPETIVMAGATVLRSDVEEALCAAFTEAVTEWCDRPADNKGSFNTVLFEKLKKADKIRGTSYATNIQREVPLVFGRGLGAGETAENLVSRGTPGAAGDIAKILHEGYVTGARFITGDVSDVLTGANRTVGRGVRSGFALGQDNVKRAETIAELRGINQAAKDLKMPTAGWRFPDGLIPPRQIIEIKGPGDEYDPDQRREYQKFSKPGNPIDVDCVNCGAPCVNDKKAPNDGCT